MIIIKKIFVFIFILLAISSFAQEGGKSVYKFLELTNSARVASLGGNVISINDSDLNFTFHNPALLNNHLSNNLVLNYVNYFSDINYGYVSYSKTYNEYGSFAIGLHYINYGEFDRTDEFGIMHGKFYAAEYALNLIYSKAIDSSFSVGVNIKPVYSVLEAYSSFGLVADLGINYISDNKLFSGALVLKNAGMQIKPYRENNKEPVPFDIQVGITKKLAHAPFRLSLIANHLVKYDLSYENPAEVENDIFINTTSKKDSKIKEHADKMMRHVIIGLEILPISNFYINLGYNYRRRQELKIDTRSYTVGFSWGFGFKISKYRFNYGRATYHLAGATNHFSISTNLSRFYRKNLTDF